MTVRCVVFDIDDTLYLERDYVRSGFEAIAPFAERAAGGIAFARSAWELFEAGVRNRIFDEVFERAGVRPAPGLIDELVRRYREHAPGIALLEDARACLHQLQGRVRLAAITDGPVPSQRAKARALGLSTWMDPIVFTGELGPGRGKPDPTAFRRVEQRTSCSGPECAYVADNPAKDFKAPRALGWRTVRIRRARGLHFGSAKSDDVDRELPDLSSVPALLGVNPTARTPAAPVHP